MLFTYDYEQTLNLLGSYVFIYNLSLIPLFTIIFQFKNSYVKTIHIFNTLSFNLTVVKLLIISFLSAAGIPPFVGFFSKIFIFTLLSNNYISTVFVTFFILLFTSLYFYMQNIRFLNTSNAQNSNIIFEKNIRIPVSFYYVCFPIVFILIFGFTLIDDLLLYFSWLFY